MDPRKNILSKNDFIVMMNKVSIESDEFLLVVSIANESELLDVLIQYLKKNKLSKDNGYVNLWIGLTSSLMVNSLRFQKNMNYEKKITSLQILSIDSFRKSYKLLPMSGLCCSELGRYLFFRNNNMSEGILLLEKGVKIAPGNSRCHKLLADVYSNSVTKYGNITNAINEYKIAIKISPDYSSAYSGLAFSYLYAKKYEECLGAIKMYKKLINYSKVNDVERDILFDTEKKILNKEL
jgi:tetratricopeptide (TPR) repeat protein